MSLGPLSQQVHELHPSASRPSSLCTLACASGSESSGIFRRSSRLCGSESTPLSRSRRAHTLHKSSTCSLRTRRRVRGCSSLRLTYDWTRGCPHASFRWAADVAERPPRTARTCAASISNLSFARGQNLGPGSSCQLTAWLWASGMSASRRAGSFGLGYELEKWSRSPEYVIVGHLAFGLVRLWYWNSGCEACHFLECNEATLLVQFDFMWVSRYCSLHEQGSVEARNWFLTLV